MQRRRPISNRPRAARPAAPAAAPKQRRHREHPQVNPLIVPRRVAAAMLSVSIATMIRMEQRGTLRPITLNDGDSAPRYYRVADLQALVGVASGASHVGA